MKAENIFGPNSKREAWEPVMFTTYAVATAILVFGVANKPATDIKSWAQSEAVARKKVKEADADAVLKFGVHYDTEEQYKFDDKGNPWDPFKQEEDDDDDEDDEDEDEE